MTLERICDCLCTFGIGECPIDGIDPKKDCANCPLKRKTAANTFMRIENK